MTEIDTHATTRYRDALAAIWDRSGYDRGFISNPFAGDDEAKRGLTRTSAVLDALGNPQVRVPLIHVAGSKGKGSTTVLIDAILRAAGMRSGRFTSPHLHSYRERFIVDDRPIDEDDFATLTETIMHAVHQAESKNPSMGRVTAWELSTAMALQWFAQTGCDVAVIEVGMGGTLDATNVIDPLISIITRLDVEHTAILGDTIPEIAANKAGIIKSGRPSVTIAQSAEALTVLQHRADEVGSELAVGERDWFVTGDESLFAVRGPWGTTDHLRTSLIGQHQVENAALAATAVELAFAQQRMPQSSIREGLLSAHHPGRYEIVRQNEGPTIIIDGAHTPIAAAALGSALQSHTDTDDIVLIVAMLDDKSPDQFLEPLSRLAPHWIITTLDSPRAMPTQKLATALDTLHQPYTSASSIADAITDAHHDTGNDRVIVITGSLTSVAEARVHLGLATPDPPPTSR